MKEFLENNKITYNLMSFTAFKSLLLFSYILNTPRSYDEIKTYFERNPYIKEAMSKDTFRVYIYSLERLGCKIDKIKSADGLKYKLSAHPFKLKIKDEQVKSIIKVFKMLMADIEIDDLLALTRFFDKIAVGVENEELKEKLVNISPLKKIRDDILETLYSACKKQENLVFEYKSPKSGVKKVQLCAKQLSVLNGKIYLFGKSSQYTNMASFLVEKIVAVPVVQINKTELPNEAPVIVTCEIYDKNIELKNNEKVVSQDNAKRVVEISSENLFFTRQRILALGSDCKVLEPQNFKDEIVSLLKQMREAYLAETV